MTKTVLSLILMASSSAVAEPRCGQNTSEIVAQAMKSTVRIQSCVKVAENSSGLPDVQFPPGISEEQKKQILEQLKKQMEDKEQSGSVEKDQNGQPMNCGGIGSGIVLDDHRVITNSHVINDGKDLAELRITVNDGRMFKGQLVGHDTELDLAVLKIEDKFNVVNDSVKLASFAPSAELKIGDQLIAIGQPFGLSKTVSFLSASFHNRIAPTGKKNRYLQLDGAVNPGNSGGPLFDCSGRVVGVNAAIIGSGTSAGIAFAIPSEVVVAVTPHLAETEGEFEGSSLGITIGVQGATETTPQQVVVAEVKESGLAQTMGMKPGDIIVSIKGVLLKGEPGLVGALLAEIKTGTEVTLVADRDGKKMNFTGSMAAQQGPR